MKIAQSCSDTAALVAFVLLSMVSAACEAGANADHGSPTIAPAGIQQLEVLKQAREVSAVENIRESNVRLDPADVRVVQLKGDAGGRRFDGIGVVNGGGATSVLLKNYPEPQRSQILDLVYKPKCGASVSALMVEIPGDGNSTQGSMPSHMHTRDDLNYSRGYTWWILCEARKRNPKLTLDAAAWSAPGWLGRTQNAGKAEFWSQDTADYYLRWLEGLRSVHGLELDAIGCRNEKGVNFDFVKRLRATLDAGGFDNVKIHAFDNWQDWKLDFVKDLRTDSALRNSIDILGAHVFYANKHALQEVQQMAAQMRKPIWNTEDHVYLKGFECAIGIVECFNDNFIHSGATRVVNWYDIAGVYPIQPFSEDPPAVLAWWPWSGHYKVREALWGYAHYGQFSEAGWQYLNGGCGELAGGGSFVTLKSPGDDYSIIIETKDARQQSIRFEIGAGLSTKELCVWRSNAKEQFVQQPTITPVDGAFTIPIEPETIYSLSTTTGQQKGSFENVPNPEPFPFPYFETFEQYDPPSNWGYLPLYTADIAGVFEINDRPDSEGKCLRQVIPVPTISWAPDWMPYTILGDDQWQDYDVSADVYLNVDDSAAVMGRVNHVGTGYGFVPKGYFLELRADGQCRLVVVRGKKDPKNVVGDAEQQALIKAGKFEGEGGERVLGAIDLPAIKPNQWHNVALRFEGPHITGLVDGQPALTATDRLYTHGMAGLMAGGDETKLSQPYFDNVWIRAVNAAAPAPSKPTSAQVPIYTATPVPSEQETLPLFTISWQIDKDEYWWPGVISQADRFPLTSASKYAFDFLGDTAYNQGQPLLISSTGRYIWNDMPFSFSIENGTLTAESNLAPFASGRAGSTLRTAYAYCSRHFFPPSGRLPAERLFTEPQFNTWIELTYNQNQKDILAYARGIIAHGFAPGVLMIDEGWFIDYGNWDFAPSRFPEPQAMLDELHQLGFKVIVWIVPYYSPNGPFWKAQYMNSTESGEFIWIGNADQPTLPAVTHWWNGFGNVIDLSSPHGQRWFKAQLGRLVDTYGVDGFKFDGGDALHYVQPRMLSQPQSYKPNITANEHSELYTKVGLAYSFNEYRAAWKMGGQPIVMRLCDKDHSWKALQELIPGSITQGLMGYPFVCPDLVGGGQYLSFLDGTKIDEELVVRAAQCHALMPMMQFSVAPWRILSPENLEYCVEAANLHTRMGAEIFALAEDAARTGEPIVRSLDYQYPGQGYEAITDQYLLGAEILVAPVLQKGTRQRPVVFPPGRWQGPDGTIIEGPGRMIIAADLWDLPWYRLLN